MPENIVETTWELRQVEKNAENPLMIWDCFSFVFIDFQLFFLIWFNNFVAHAKCNRQFLQKWVRIFF